MTEPENLMEPDRTARPGARRRRLTVAGVAALGLAAGGAVLADASFASGGGSSSSGTSSSSAPMAPAPGRGGPLGAPGGKYDLDGVVTAASSSSLTVKNQFGTSRTYTVNSKTKVHSGPGSSSSLDASDIDTGDRVHVHAEKSGSKYVADDVDIRHPHLGGTVTDVSGDDVTITDNDGFTRHITVSSSTKYTKDGKSASKSVLVDGAVVNAEGTVDSDRTTLDATRVDVVTKAPTPRGPGGRGGHGMGPGNGSRPQPPAGAPSGQPSGAPSSQPSGSSS